MVAFSRPPAALPLQSPAPAPATLPAVRPWRPERVLFTPAALDEPFGREVLARVEALRLPVERLAGNRLTDLRGDTERETYRRAKRTLAVVTAPPSAFKLAPIPPSADFQFHLAQGCPAHCQYCYLAGSLSGPPVTRVYANLPALLERTRAFERKGHVTSFEVSCYTDPLALEHLTGALSTCVRHFAAREGAHLRFVTKFDATAPLEALAHGGRTRARFSVGPPGVERLEGGTAPVAARLQAASRLARAGYPVGLVVAPVMPLPGWREAYGALLDGAREALGQPEDLTFELISHRFTPGSRDTLLSWYPSTPLDLDPAGRVEKRHKFGGVKYVYPAATQAELRAFLERGVAERFPQARVLYWT